MSYILEALKESQRSRDEQRVPDIMTVHAADETVGGRSVRSPLLWIVVVLILLASAAGWWLAGQRGHQPTVSPPLATNPDVAPRQALPVDAAVPGAQESRVSPLQPAEPEKLNTELEEPVVVAEPVTTPEPVIALEPAPEQEPPVVAAAEDAEVTSVTSLAPAAEPVAVVVEESGSAKGNLSRPATEQPTAIDTVAIAPALSTESLPSAGPDVDASVPEPLPEALPEPEPEPAQERIPHYRELPYEVQQIVEGVKYSVHLYSPNPERRLVKINGIVRREGSEVAPGLVLEQVTPDGAVFTYREYRFRVPVR